MNEVCTSMSESINNLAPALDTSLGLSMDCSVMKLPELSSSANFNNGLMSRRGVA